MTVPRRVKVGRVHRPAGVVRLANDQTCNRCSRPQQWIVDPNTRTYSGPLVPACDEHLVATVRAACDGTA